MAEDAAAWGGAAVDRLVVGTYDAQGAAGLVPIVGIGDDWRIETPIATIRNASFGIVSPRRGLRYLVDEEAGTVSVHAADRWTTVARADTGGDAPCHLALSGDETQLAVAHYDSGTVAIFALDAAGLPTTRTLVADRGSGPDAERQRGPHAHWVGFAPSGLLTCVDLGADRIVARDAAAPDAQRVLYAAPPGSGPRHLAFHPTRPIAYLVSELAATLTMLHVRDGAWAAAAILPTAPAGTAADNLGGAIAVAGNRLYVSNRGHDSIATFALDQDGRPHPLGHVPSGGRSPRFLLPLGERLIVAHEEGGGVAVFTLDDGIPRPAPVMLDIPGAAFVMVDRAPR